MSCIFPVFLPISHTPKCQKLFTVLAGLRICPSADKDLDPASENAPVPDPTLEVAIYADIGPTEKVYRFRRKMSNK
jgi:hypothetical protein